MRPLILVKILVAAMLPVAAANAATTIIDFNDLTAPGFSGDFQLFASSVGGVATSPNGTPFLAVPSASTPSGTAVYTPASGAITNFSFDWGTPDNYNTLSFFHGATLVASFSGANLPAGVHSYSFAASDGVDSVSFGSTNRAFEIDDVSVTTVPEPATWGLMLAGFAMVGFAARRRSQTATA